MADRRLVPVIYNLFPLLAGKMDRWISHVIRAHEMGFNWVYINPFHYPGFSGSLYAVKNYYDVNPAFLPEGHTDDGMEVLQKTLSSMLDAGLWPVMDLIVNHTARDSILVKDHPEWYIRSDDGTIVSPFARDPDNPDNIIVWGDLAEINNDNSRDRRGLRAYWAELLRYYLHLGFKGFRCDAAYKVPSSLWSYLIKEALKVDGDAVFFAETLGCTEEEGMALKEAGFHYFFNSSKWWDFEQPWCLEQHEMFGTIAPSISFPETHDTTRLAADTHGNIDIQRQRYMFAIAFSAGIMMPVGYEFGFRKKLDVVRTSVADWENPYFDIMNFIRSMNNLKYKEKVLQGEGTIRVIEANPDSLVLDRSTECAPDSRMLVVINKKIDRKTPVLINCMNNCNAQTFLYRIGQEGLVVSGFSDFGEKIILNPAEIVYIISHT